MRRDYELALIINPEVSEEETRAILDRVEQIVVNHDGQIVRINQWGRRRLAYPIQRHRDGFYVFFDMILTPETVIELERTLKVSESVLRHMSKKRDSKVVQKEREDREARAAAAAANAAAAASTAESEAAVAEETPGITTPEDAPVVVVTAPEEVPVAEEAPEELEAVPVLTEADMEDVPPAIEEETVEA